MKKLWYNNKAASQGSETETASWKPNNARKSNDPWNSFEEMKKESQDKTKKHESNNASVIEQDWFQKAEKLLIYN